jgi:hypothetical protein
MDTSANLQSRRRRASFVSPLQAASPRATLWNASSHGPLRRYLWLTGHPSKRKPEYSCAAHLHGLPRDSDGRPPKEARRTGWARAPTWVGGMLTPSAAYPQRQRVFAEPWHRFCFHKARAALRFQGCLHRPALVVGFPVSRAPYFMRMESVLNFLLPEELKENRWLRG